MTFCQNERHCALSRHGLDAGDCLAMRRFESATTLLLQPATALAFLVLGLAPAAAGSSGQYAGYSHSAYLSYLNAPGPLEDITEVPRLRFAEMVAFARVGAAACQRLARAAPGLPANLTESQVPVPGATRARF